jgi:hypothetical protein
MKDVERWLVEKKNEKGGDGGEGTSKVNLLTSHPVEGTVNEMRDEFMTMQGHIGELGREMAKFATSPGMLSTITSRFQPKPCPPPLRPVHPSRSTHRRAPQLPSTFIHSHQIYPPASVSRISIYCDLRRRESVSPPFILLPPSAPNNHDHVCHTQLETIHLPPAR